MTSLVLRQAMQQHLLLTIIIIQGIFIIDNTWTQSINEALEDFNKHKTRSNPALLLNKPEFIKEFSKRYHIKNILRRLFREETKIKQTVEGVSIKIKDGRFQQLMKDTNVESYLHKTEEENVYDGDLDSSEDNLQSMKTKWFIRIN